MKGIKQVIIVRKDLKMGVGKTAVQCAHASLQVFINMMRFDYGKVHQDPNGLENEKDDEDFVNLTLEMRVGTPLFNWLVRDNDYGYDDNYPLPFKKVCVYVNNEDELIGAYEKAKLAGIPCSIITDGGRTTFHNIATNTVVAIGPATDDEIDVITEAMKLL